MKKKKYIRRRNIKYRRHILHGYFFQYKANYLQDKRETIEKKKQQKFTNMKKKKHRKRKNIKEKKYI